MKILDLYCGAGGAAEGIHQAGPDDITGIDSAVFEEYPFKFAQMDISTMRPALLTAYDFIWASPPCQAYSRASDRAKRKGHSYFDLIEYTRNLLLMSGKPFVIENVPGAPIRKDLMLCGTMFGLKVFRHRYFEIEGFPVKQPAHYKHNGRTKNHRYPFASVGGYVQVTGHAFSLKEGQEAMEIDWISNCKHLAQAVPPAYSKYIFSQFLRGL